LRTIDYRRDVDAPEGGILLFVPHILGLITLKVRSIIIDHFQRDTEV
jgi:hypothetical protein